jgi:hypothetical protein
MKTTNQLFTLSILLVLTSCTDKAPTKQTFAQSQSWLTESLNQAQIKRMDLGAKDKGFWLRSHVQYTLPDKLKVWNSTELKATIVAAQYVPGFSGRTGDAYLGLPVGRPITSAWKFTYYTGEEPSDEHCVEPDKQAYFDDSITEKVYFTQKDKYRACLGDYYARVKASKRYLYYYARTPSNFKLNIPKRPANHAHYQLDLNFGPLGKLDDRGLRPEELAIKDTLYSTPCTWKVCQEDKKMWYTLPGEPSELWISLRSVLYAQSADNGKLSTRWQVSEGVRFAKLNWQKIKGISLNKAQFEYMSERCDHIAYPLEKCFLGLDAPELSPEQSAYIKTHTWAQDKAAYAIKPRAKKIQDTIKHNPWL